MKNKLKGFLTFPIIVILGGVGVMLYAWYCNENGPWNWDTILLLTIIGGAIAFVGLLVLFYFLLKKETTKNDDSTISASESNADELKKFKELLDAGVITQEEFEAKKKQLLNL